MDIIQSIILGIVQGITEWLPISSKSHLILLQNFFGVVQPAIFDLMLHLGSLAVVFVVFWKDIMKIVRGALALDKYYLKFLGLLIVATIPVAVIGFIFKHQIETALSNLYILGFGFLFTAIMLFFSKFPIAKDRTLNYFNSSIIGIGQAFSVLPGISRSGMTISTGMILGIKKDDVAKFSFLMFIPAILGATILEIKDIGSVSNIPAMIVGMVCAMIAGYLALRLLLDIIKKDKFYWFSIYCGVLGVLVLLFAYKVF